ncbi:hypothetical protein WG906_07770 [Pedobacter sp. P351]|uniref:hypothetical protein n=1 Tax=Pedobacter superstes TaxID=3133441 RepID=UPI0030A0ACE6
MMKRLIYMLAVFAALTANSAMAQNREQVVSRTYESGTYSDERGEYRWQLIEKRVWIPEYQTRGILGIGVRTIPGHYEMRTDRVKVYTNGRNGDYDSKKGNKGNHPHGMPPGQRKKQEKNGNYYY